MHDDDQHREDDEDAVAALAEVIAGPEGGSDPAVAECTHQLSADIDSTRSSSGEA